jgi:hypothetical protein
MENNFSLEKFLNGDNQIILRIDNSDGAGFKKLKLVREIFDSVHKRWKEVIKSKQPLMKLKKYNRAGKENEVYKKKCLESREAAKRWALERGINNENYAYRRPTLKSTDTHEFAIYFKIDNDDVDKSSREMILNQFCWQISKAYNNL